MNEHTFKEDGNLKQAFKKKQGMVYYAHAHTHWLYSIKILTSYMSTSKETHT